MSVEISRRNGRQASCEPCRKSKIRCDHRKPVCARCQRRGLEARCWYNPSPLTRTRHGNTGGDPPPQSWPPDSRNRHPDPAIVGNAARTDNLQPGNNILLRPDNQTSRGRGHTEQIHRERQAVLTEIVGELHYLPTIENLLLGYFSFSQVALIPKILILQMASSIRDDPETCSLVSRSATDATCNPELVDHILRSTASNVTLTPDLDYKDFCTLYCGSNLRVETLGLLFTVAARSFSHTRIHDGQNLDKLFQTLYRCSNLCLRLAHDVVLQINDVLIWLTYENLLLTTLVEGDASLGVWQRLGNLSTDVYALGLHREASLSPQRLPFFLSELRRKTYVSAYRADKVLAPIFERPPRILRLFADCKMPLDLADNELFAESPEVLEKACDSLSEDGWNTESKYRSTTWARLRYILGEFREETNECTFLSSASIDPTKLRETSRRCHEKWESLSPHLRYNESCWASDLPKPACMMLANAYLSYLYVDFQIHRMLAKHHSDSLSQLWEVSATMLQTILQVVRWRDTDKVLFRGLPTVLLAYGLPCAVILTAALRDTVREDSRKLPSTLYWSTLVRNLYVFNSHLESICGPGQTNHEFCVHASKTISNTLDELLDNLAGSSNRTTPNGGRIGATILYTSPSALPSLNNTDATVPPHSPHNEPTSFSNITDLNDLDVWSGIDLADWAMNIDWTGTDSVWNTL